MQLFRDGAATRGRRPLRGLPALLILGLGATVWLSTYSGDASFALPAPLVASHTEAPVRGLASGRHPALGPFGQVQQQQGGQAGAGPLHNGAAASGGAASQRPLGGGGGGGGGGDSVSLMLAAAGMATALKAAATARRATEGEEATPEAEEETLFQKSKVFIYIGLWYVFNIGYNIYNKKALIAYPYPWAVALWQMCFGCLIFMPLWALGIRKTPKMTMEQVIRISPSALGHLATHVGAVVAFFAGAVSFGHIVKASEPVVSSVLNFAFMGEVLPWPVYAALLPIIAGVGLASASELSFTWLCFGAAMASNVGSASRAVYSKKVMGGGNIGENMDSANVYAVLTILATLILLPVSFLIEGPTTMLKGFKVAYAAGGTPFLLCMLYSGFTYYMYNEVAFLALGKLDPVSHAVANTMKRVVIIITSIIVFNTPVNALGVAGSSIAVCGTLLYSLAKNKFVKK